MTERRNKPELLSPAGDFERLRMAVLYGADAVYLAGTSFGMRAFAGNFSPEELPKAVTFAHSHGVRVHATVNTMPRNSEAWILTLADKIVASREMSATVRYHMRRWYHKVVLTHS